MPVQPTVRPQKIALLIARRIVNDISRNGSLAGDRLPPEHLMLEEYQVSRGTLREALRFLELQGIITLKTGPGGGPIVQDPDGSNVGMALTLLLQFRRAPFRTVSEARVGLEPMMAQLAAKRMSEPLLSKLQDSVETMAANLSDREVFLSMNKLFHDTIAHGSGNAVFGALIESLLGILDGSAMGVDYPEPRRKAVLKAHMSIYEAIASRDPEASATAMREHIHEYLRYVERRYPELLDAPIVWSEI
jgi:GntR family transcriptional repressor for pyruvate dehydrogenase complex